MKKYTQFILPALFLCLVIISCQRGIRVETQNEIIELKDFKPVSGLHCESTSMLNALTYQGFYISEAAINGLARSLTRSIPFSFTIFTNYPFPQAGGDYFKKNFLQATGLKCIEAYPQSPQQAYEQVKDVLRKGIPVVLRVNMRYLPYLWGGQYGDEHTSFGWHYVALIKIDEQQGYAWVTETGDKAIYKVALYDLAKARNAREGFMPTDNYFYYFENPQTVVLDYEKAFKQSLQKMIEEYRADTGILAGLRVLPDCIKNIEQYIQTPYILNPLFSTAYGYIETYGTGGSIFRNFYRDFLNEIGTRLQNKEILAAAQIVDESCKCWNKLAVEFLSISEQINKHMGNKEKRQEYYNKAAGLAQKVFEAETRIYQELKLLLAGEDKD